MLVMHIYSIYTYMRMHHMDSILLQQFSHTLHTICYVHVYVHV